MVPVPNALYRAGTLIRGDRYQPDERAEDGKAVRQDHPQINDKVVHR